MLLIKRKKDIAFYGSVFKYISKHSTITVNHFSFNKEWDVNNRFKKTRFGRFEIQNSAKLMTGIGCIMRSGATLVIFSGGEIIMGNNVAFNNNCEIYSSNHIEIGDGTIFSNNCIIRDSDIHKISSNGGCNTKPIKIGKHVWFGTNCIILKGVTIGDGAVVAAGSVVTKDIPPRALAAGNPARVIKNNIEWER